MSRWQQGERRIVRTGMAQDATTPRDVLIAAGRQRLLTHGIEALRGLLNASALSRDVPVSRDTAYRVFRDEAADDSVADAVVMAVAEAAHELDWAGDNAAQAAAIEAYATNVNAGHDSATATKEVLRASYEAQFQSPGLAATWLLQAAALTASEAWQGDRPTEDGIDLCRRILALRRDYYRTGEDHVAGLFALAFSEIGRRPRSGIDPRTIVMLIHCLLDGAVLHRLLDPDSITPELAAEAMYLLGLAFTEVGLSVDARRPDDERALETFDRLIDAAATLWSIRPEISVEDAASTAETPMDAARSLFPDIGDLADSLLRSRVVAGGFMDLGPFPDPTRARQHLPALAAELRRLRDLADAIPHVIAATRIHLPTRSKTFADDFIESEGRVLAVLEVQRPEQLARDLVEFAARGSSGWPSVVALMATTGYET